MPLVQTRGAASAQGFGEFAQASAVPNYIEDVFSCFLYTGTGANQTITNNIDLSNKGGLIWVKDRVVSGLGVDDHYLQDTVRGVRNPFFSNLTDAQLSNGDLVTSVSTTGFVDAFGWPSNNKLVSWTFRKQPKFFDIQTWTGNATNRTIAHSLGSVPGCIIVKRFDAGGAWQVYHRSLANTEYLVLNTTAAKATGATRWNSTTPTSAVFSLGTDATVNASAGTYVAYIFAHNAGGFGLTGTDNVISCGTYSVDAVQTQVTVNLGYEPQWLLIKRATGGTGAWYLFDNMRGIVTGDDDNQLQAQSTGSEAALGPLNAINLTSTGFETGTSGGVLQPSSDYIYIAIRRGPMKVPTDATKVFGLSARTGTGANATVTGGQTDDAVLVKNRGSAVASLFSSRLTGTGYMVTSASTAEVAAGTTILQANPWDVMDGVKVGTTSTITNASANTYINYLFKRAPSFMDVVCYTGTQAYGTQITHNLGVVPELLIVKQRSAANDWFVLGTNLSTNKQLYLSYADPADGTAGANFGTTGDVYVAPTSSIFTLGNTANTNASGGTFIAYLFATCAGVSKVGTYTGNGTTQTIDCGITAGARFVLIKKTSATGDWYVYDTARGMTTLTDPYWLADTTAAEVATLGSVTTVATGFALNSSVLAAINTNAATFIFLAIA